MVRRRFPCLAASLRLSAGTALSVLLLATIASGRADEPVGHVIHLEGGAVAEIANLQHAVNDRAPVTLRRGIEEGSVIFAGDMLTTDSHGLLDLMMSDSTGVSLGASTMLGGDPCQVLLG